MDIIAAATAIVVEYAARLAAEHAKNTAILGGWDFNVGSIAPEFDL